MDRGVRNKDLIVRVLVLLLVGIFFANLYINTNTLIKVNTAVGITQDCVEVSGKCYQNRIESNNSSTNIIITALTASFVCTRNREGLLLDRSFEEIKECVFNTLERDMP